jgi:hypothetical protein
MLPGTPGSLTGSVKIPGCVLSSAASGPWARRCATVAVTNRQDTVTTIHSVTLLGALSLLFTACGPEPGTTTDSTTETTSSTTGTTASTSEAPTTTGSTTDTTGVETTTGVEMTTGVDTTGVDTTTGGVCLEFETQRHPNGEEAPAQFTCGHDEVLCPSAPDVALFEFEQGPEWDDTATTEDLARVHCVIEALRDRKLGTVTYALFWPVFGPDTGSLEITSEFVIARRETLNDFNYDYWETALVLEPSQVFADCLAENTATAAWLCLRPYINLGSTTLECVTAPLTCE